MSMKEAGNLLSRVTGKELRFYSTYDFGRQKDENNLSVIIDDEEEARNLVLNIRPELSEGLVTFVGTTKCMGTSKHEVWSWSLEKVIPNLTSSVSPAPMRLITGWRQRT